MDKNDDNNSINMDSKKFDKRTFDFKSPGTVGAVDESQSQIQISAIT